MFLHLLCCLCFLNYFSSSTPLTFIELVDVGNKTYGSRNPTELHLRSDGQSFYAVYGELNGGSLSGLAVAKLDLSFRVQSIAFLSQPQVESGTTTVLLSHQLMQQIRFTSSSIDYLDSLYVFAVADIQVRPDCEKQNTGRDIFIIKIDKNMNKLWCFTFGLNSSNCLMNLGTAANEENTHGVADYTGEYIYAFGYRIQVN